MAAPSDTRPAAQGTQGAPQEAGTGRHGTRHPGHDKGRDSKDQAPSILEWLAAGLGLLLVLASVAVLGWETLQGGNRPPLPRFQVQAIEQPSERQWQVTVTIRNDGQQTAAGLRFSGELRRGAELVERSEATIDYLPPGATRRAGLFFRHDPRTLDLQLRAEGYQKP